MHSQTNCSGKKSQLKREATLVPWSGQRRVCSRVALAPFLHPRGLNHHPHHAPPEPCMREMDTRPTRTRKGTTTARGASEFCLRRGGGGGLWGDTPSRRP